MRTTFLILALFLQSCFTPNYADCAFRCAAEEPVCPEEYVCRQDGYCHRPDREAICALPSLPGLPDLPANSEGGVSDDLSSSDGL